MKRRTPPSKEEVTAVIADRDVCDSTCEYFLICPFYRTSGSCTVRTNSSLLLDSFYNIAFGGKEGMIREMRSVLLKYAKSIPESQKPQDSMNEYLAMLSKFSGIIYPQDKGKAFEPVTSIEFKISPVDETKLHRSKE